MRKHKTRRIRNMKKEKEKIHVTEEVKHEGKEGRKEDEKTERIVRAEAEELEGERTINHKKKETKYKRRRRKKERETVKLYKRPNTKKRKEGKEIRQEMEGRKR